MGDVSEAKEVFTERKRQILERVDLSRDVSDEEMQELIDRKSTRLNSSHT